MTPHPKRILASLFVLSLLQAGCGQKGDLYLPAIPEAPTLVQESREASSANVNAEQSQSTANDTGQQKKPPKRTGAAEPEKDE